MLYQISIPLQSFMENTALGKYDAARLALREARTYDTERRDYAVSSPNFLIQPDKIQVLSVSSGVLAFYQKKMSKAVWRPAPGRKLGFLVTHGTDFAHGLLRQDVLLGIIFLASPSFGLERATPFCFQKQKTLRNSITEMRQKIIWT
jgi:hypothetical protein